MKCVSGDLFMLTKKQILTNWSKSSSREQAVHKTFDEKMVQKTLVHSGCNMIINSTPEYQMGMDEETNIIENKLPEIEKYEDFEEVQEEPQNVDAATGEIKEVETKEEDKLEF